MAPLLRAVLFDVFGTVVDWRSAVIAEARSLAAGDAAAVDWGAFADRWRTEGYLTPIGEIVGGVRPYEEVEALLATALARLAAEEGVGFGPGGLERLATVWRRLDPWPDVLGGLARLKERFLIAPLSNGSFALLSAMAKRAGLPWDCVISTELFGRYKPDPATYRGAVRLLGLAPGEVMLVAAHPGDLRAAAACGLRTAYVPRPLEWGPGARPPAATDPGTDPGADIVAHDFADLADRLGAPGDPVVRPTPLTAGQRAYLESQVLGRLATVDDAGRPHVAPVGYSYNEALGTIDIAGFAMSTTAKFRHVARRRSAALVVDDVLPPWRPRGVEIRGRAEALDHAPGAETGLIRLYPERVHAWGEGLRAERPNGR